MDKEYFTPALEDIRIGYECEWLQDPSKDFWIPLNITADRYKFIVQNGQEGIDFGIRTAYLTREEIELEPVWWVYQDLGEDSYYCIVTKTHDFHLYTKENHQIVITSWDEVNEDLTLFRGECKSINELRYISKLIGINA